MKRRTVLQALAVATVFPLISACLRSPVVGKADSPITPLNKPHEEWRKLLSPRAYQILFEEATERPESSNLVYEEREGTFICAACYLPLFESSHKYESWTGWPSFTQPIAGHMATKIDFTRRFGPAGNITVHAVEVTKVMYLAMARLHVENVGATMALH